MSRRASPRGPRRDADTGARRPITDGGTPPFFEATPDPVIEYRPGPDGPRVRRVNTAFRGTFDVAGDPAGRDLAAVLASAADGDDAGESGNGRDAGDAAGPDGESAADVLDHVRTGESVTVRVTCGTATGRRSFLLRTVPVGDGGYVVYSDLPAASVSPGRVDMVDAFIHNIRNPLEVAEIYLEAARESGDEDHFAEVAAAHERMERIASDALRLTKEGRVIDDPRPTDLANVVDDAWRTIRAGGATLDTGTLGTVHADTERLQQLFENLFRNSVEHGSTSSRAEPDDAVEHGSTSPPSHAREDAVEHGSTSSRAQPDDAVDHDRADVTVDVGPLADGFYVADDGPGIPPDDRERVLEPGYTTAADGTGLGLPIVVEIAEAHGWDVDLVESDSGGARFEFTGVGSEER